MIPITTRSQAPRPSGTVRARGHPRTRTISPADLDGAPFGGGDGASRPVRTTPAEPARWVADSRRRPGRFQAGSRPVRRCEMGVETRNRQASGRRRIPALTCGNGP